jgi:hypothetical protein
MITYAPRMYDNPPDLSSLQIAFILMIDCYIRWGNSLRQETYVPRDDKHILWTLF